MRTRLSTEQRRAQLVAIGTELFARRPYEEVSIEEVAQTAQVSSGLLYHYFPSKRAFFLAIVAEQGARLVDASVPDPSLSPADQVKAALEVYLDSAERSPDAYRMAHTIVSTDRDAQELRQQRVTVQRDRILASLAAMIAVDEEAKLAVSAWLAFAQTATVTWLDNPRLSRTQVRDLCIRALWAAVGLPPTSDVSAIRTEHP